MRLPLTILAAGWLAICDAQAQQLDKVTFATNWVAQAEHGGFYQAVADGTYKKHGLDVTILPGGPNVNHRLQLIAGRVEFYMSANTLQAFDAVAQNIPTLVISARVPGALQHEVMQCRTGTLTNNAFVTVPGLRRTTKRCCVAPGTRSQNAPNPLEPFPASPRPMAIRRMHHLRRTPTTACESPFPAARSARPVSSPPGGPPCFFV